MDQEAIRRQIIERPVDCYRCETPYGVEYAYYWGIVEDGQECQVWRLEGVSGTLGKIAICGDREEAMAVIQGEAWFFARNDNDCMEPAETNE